MANTTEVSLDALTPLGRRILRSGAERAYERLVVGDAAALTVRDELEAATPGMLLAMPVADAHEAACVHAGLWLWHDAMEEAHTICQAIETPTGSYWHAILHRREGDFSNAKYWFARCEGHAVAELMAHNVHTILNPLPADKMLLRLTVGGWNAGAFVDLVQRVHALPDGDVLKRAAVAVQQMEWRMLFDLCCRRATAVKS